MHACTPATITRFKNRLNKDKLICDMCNQQITVGQRCIRRGHKDTLSVVHEECFESLYINC